MVENLAKWTSKRGPVTKIRPSDGCRRDAVPLAVGRWYKFHESGCHLGNVGLVQAKSESSTCPPPCHASSLRPGASASDPVSGRHSKGAWLSGFILTTDEPFWHMQLKTSDLFESSIIECSRLNKSWNSIGREFTHSIERRCRERSMPVGETVSRGKRRQGESDKDASQDSMRCRLTPKSP